MDLCVEVSTDNTNIVWHKDGQAIDKNNSDYSFKSEGKKHSLIINNSTVHHEGEFVVSVGEQECSCELTVVGKFSIFLSNVGLGCCYSQPSDSSSNHKLKYITKKGIEFYILISFRKSSRVHQEA